jgi:hypothetical protein
MASSARSAVAGPTRGRVGVVGASARRTTTVSRASLGSPVWRMKRAFACR